MLELKYILLKCWLFNCLIVEIPLRGMEDVAVSIGGGLWHLWKVDSSCRRFYDITRSPFPKGISCNLIYLEFEAIGEIFLFFEPC